MTLIRASKSCIAAQLKTRNAVKSFQLHPLIQGRSILAVSKSTSAPMSAASTTSSLENINKKRAFVEIYRRPEPYRDPIARLDDWEEINFIPTEETILDRRVQAARCMDCGTPFCQTHTGCPINNLIPEWNELVYRGEFKEANDRLHKTNNFPEFTGRVCPAPCEGSCVAGLVDDPVTIKNIEYAIVDKAWEEGFITPRIPKKRSGLKVVIVGSGPAGLACADQLNQMGHHVVVYEREDNAGGLLMYGIPNMKLEKEKVFRRIEMLTEEGVTFKTNVHLGVDVSMEEMQSNENAHAVVFCTGSTVPRDLEIKGRDLTGIHFAMEFLTKNQKRLLLTKEGKLESGWDRKENFVTAEGKNVIVIGGGDTGTDCIATSMRHRCQSVVNFEYNPKPPSSRDEKENPWPEYPRVFGVDYGHGEVQAVFGKDPREYLVSAKEFVGDEEGNVKGLITRDVTLKDGKLIEVEGSEKEWKADLVILSMGFTAAEDSALKEVNLELEEGVIPSYSEQEAFDLYDRQHLGGDQDESIASTPVFSKSSREPRRIKRLKDEFYTSEEGIFAAGDCRRGQSLVVWAIREGRGAADAVQNYFKEREYLDAPREASS